MTREEMRYKLNELRMMLNDGEHGEEQGILVNIISEMDKWEEIPIYTISALSVPEREKGTDVISREAVIDLLNQFGYYDKEMERDLSAIPSAIPEREKGEWTEWKGRNGRYKGIPICSNCHTGFPVYAKDYKFCPNCGADMRGKSCRCNTCKNNDDELSGECYECVKGIFDHYEPQESEDK